MRSVVLTAAVATALLMVSGCGDNGAEQKVQEFTGLIVQTAAANRAPAAFGTVGVEVSGPLSCSATPSGDQFTLNCTGTSLDGRAVTLTGTATSAPGGSSVAGNFVGTANGSQVLTTSCLGDCSTG